MGQGCDITSERWETDARNRVQHPPRSTVPIIPKGEGPSGAQLNLPADPEPFLMLTAFN